MIPLAKPIAVLAGVLFSVAAWAQVGVSSATVKRPPIATCTNMELMKRVPCPDSAMFFTEGEAPVEAAFNARDFVRLDELYDQWCSGRDRFPDGSWKLAQYKYALRDTFAGWNVWNKHLQYIKSWQQARPTSEAARFAEAVYWQTYGWKARGAGYASTVSKEGWELFRERLGKAQAALDAPQIAHSQCPAPDALRLGLLIDEGASDKKILSTYEDAARRHPQYHVIYFAMARHYAPSWGGSAAEYEAFASRVAQTTKSFEGMGMYARLYGLMDRSNDVPFVNDPRIPPYWKKLKAGYEDLMRLYPSSIQNLGKYAGVACRSSDSALYRSLRSKLDGYQETVEMAEPVDVCDLRHGWQPHKE